MVSNFVTSNADAELQNRNLDDQEKNVESGKGPNKQRYIWWDTQKKIFQVESYKENAIQKFKKPKRDYNPGIGIMPSMRSSRLNTGSQSSSKAENLH